MRLARPLGFISAAVVVAIAVTGCSSGSPASGGAATTASSSSTAPNVPQSTGTAAQPIPQSAGATLRLGTGGVDALIAEYGSRCTKETVESLECEALRSLLVAEVTTGLLKIEKSGDQRGTEEAFIGLTLLDEPEILIAAMRVLGHFPETPNLAASVVPLMLDSAYSSVQSMASNVLIANPDQAFQELGRMWSESHNTLTRTSVYDEYPDFPSHYDAMGFPKYAGSEWFSPGDSDRSIGWSTKDDAATVAKWYGDRLHAEVMDSEKWFPMSTDQAALVLNPNDPKVARMQQLIERLMRGDQTAQAEMDKLQKEIDESSKAADKALERSVAGAAIVPGSFVRDARWIIAAKKGERISRLIVVFPIPQIQRTVIKEIWDLSDYPSAWTK